MGCLYITLCSKPKHEQPIACPGQARGELGHQTKFLHIKMVVMLNKVRNKTPKWFSAMGITEFKDKTPKTFRYLSS